MNYLQFLDESDISSMLEKCNLKLSATTQEPIRLCEDSKVGLIFCEKISLNAEDEMKKQLFEKFKNYFPNIKNSYFSVFENSVILFVSSFELIDSFNDIDFSDILFETISSKLSNNEKLYKKYKKDFTKFYKNLKKQNKKKNLNNSVDKEKI